MGVVGGGPYRNRPLPTGDRSPRARRRQPIASVPAAAAASDALVAHHERRGAPVHVTRLNLTRVPRSPSQTRPLATSASRTSGSMRLDIPDDFLRHGWPNHEM